MLVMDLFPIYFTQNHHFCFYFFTLAFYFVPRLRRQVLEKQIARLTCRMGFHPLHKAQCKFTHLTHTHSVGDWGAARTETNRHKSHTLSDASLHVYYCHEWVNENLYIAHKTSTQNLACSQRQIHTVHTCKLSQTKTTKGKLIPKSTNSSYLPTPSQKWNYT